MTPERWKRIEELFEAAFERRVEDRAVFLERECGDDHSLRAEVELMLEHQQPTGRLITTLAQEAAVLFPHATPDGADGVRFIPGAVLASRYRIIGLLGRGGMGEVYRADDLKLAQPVALKFLPEKLSKNAEALSRFHGEVRTARRVSHPNVCRVFDIGEVEGMHFLTMEYIDGEDLSSLLRRIGRLPEDKAVEIARQLCAGLAAAHEEGVLHRDLKPANVMLDGRGRARITDFGLAGLSDQFQAHEIRSGTPAYMSPEQLAGKEVTVKSDIYSLGVTLYEIFTGKKAFAASTLDELIKQHESSTPVSISSLVKDVDPVVERAILRCLEKDPKDRPASASHVAALLPGGDPLAAAIAAGETPSPEMVAAAPKEGSLRPTVAVALLAAILATLAGCVLLAERLSAIAFIPFDKSPEVLRERARDIIYQFGYTAPAIDEDYGFNADHGLEEYIEKNDTSPDRWQKLKTGQPAITAYWFRQSPNYLSTERQDVGLHDPPSVNAGMTGLLLDMRGRLLYFYGVPPQVIEADPAQQPQVFDWKLLFKEAGFDPAQFNPVESQWSPLYNYDWRQAWEGVYPDNPQIPIRVEAAAFRGKPVYFEVVNAWDSPVREQERATPASDRALFVMLSSVVIAVLIIGVLLAFGNVRRGRGDRKGALRLAVLAFAASLLNEVSKMHHVPTPAEIYGLQAALQVALFFGCLLATVYLALEPYVRRRWPHRLISWSRLVAGDFRDPLVGRDFMIGALTGLSFALITFLVRLPLLLKGEPVRPIWEPSAIRLGIGYFGISVGNQILTPLLFTFLFLFLLFMLSVILRREKLGLLGGWVFITVMWALVNGGTGMSWMESALSSALMVWVMYRYGLLATFISQVFLHLYTFFPFSTQLTAWHAAAFTLDVIILLALTGFAFYRSLGGQPLLGRAFSDD